MSLGMWAMDGIVLGAGGIHLGIMDTIPGIGAITARGTIVAGIPPIGLTNTMAGTTAGEVGIIRPIVTTRLASLTPVLVQVDIAQALHPTATPVAV